MSFHRSTPKFFASLILMLVLITCTNQGNYAPVMTSNSRLGEDQLNPLKNSQGISKAEQDISEGKQDTHKGTQDTPESRQDIPQGKQVVTEAAKKFHLVKNGETLYSIGLSSGYGYQRLALWNHISPPYKVIVGKKIKLFKPDLASELRHEQQKVTAAKMISTRPKKAGNSLAEKMNLEDGGTHKKRQTNLAVLKKTAKKQKKSIVSIDNKKISELNFDWPIKGRVLKSFSPAYNKGINIAGKLGQSVRATEAGEVVYCGQRLIGFGQLLIIKHNKVYLSAYANNRRLLVKEGQQVEKGQVIAEVGKVGTKQTSLHFEIRKNGNPVNPLKLLPKR